MSATVKSLAAHKPRGALELIEYDPGPLGPEEVEVSVSHCGICHSDVSKINDDWGGGKFPVIPGHEIVGVVSALGDQVKNLRMGQRVGIGWYGGSCMACRPCLRGDQHLCASRVDTIRPSNGGFSTKVRSHWAWATPLPDSLNAANAGPLFCGGATVFNPLVAFNVRPTDRVGVIGIGGLGHLALQFLNKWGCEVHAFTSSPSKTEELKKLGAHHVIPSRDPDAMKKYRGSLDFIISTVNVPLDWDQYLRTLAPKGRLHLVGAVLEPIPIPSFSLIVGQNSLSGSPVGPPSVAAIMVDFCARHNIQPMTETFPMSRANEALERLKSGQARYRVVLENDL